MYTNVAYILLLSWESTSSIQFNFKLNSIFSMINQKDMEPAANSGGNSRSHNPNCMYSPICLSFFFLCCLLLVFENCNFTALLCVHTLRLHAYFSFRLHACYRQGFWPVQIICVAYLFSCLLLLRLLYFFFLLLSSLRPEDVAR